MTDDESERRRIVARVEQARLRGELRARLFGEPRPVTTVGEYEILRKLGEGGSGTVFEVRDPQGRHRALKLVESRDPRTHARLRREARAFAALSHPHIVRMHDLGEHEQGVFVVLDLVEGQPLSAWLTAGHSQARVLACLMPVLDAVATAHERGILHRDLKPSNILIESPAHAWLLDFGLAKALPDSEAEALTYMSQHLTNEGDLLGTVDYMAPEVLLTRPADPRSDQFSLCVVLWEALHGQLPFDGSTLMSRSRNMIQGNVLSPTGARVSSSLEAVLRRGLRADPAARFGSVRALAQALESAPR